MKECKFCNIIHETQNEPSQDSHCRFCGHVFGLNETVTQHVERKHNYEFAQMFKDGYEGHRDSSQDYNQCTLCSYMLIEGETPESHILESKSITHDYQMLYLEGYWTNPEWTK